MENRAHVLSAFPDIPYEYGEILRSRGISTTAELLDRVSSVDDIGRLSADTGIPDYRIGELLELSRICQEEGTNPAGARKLYDEKL